MYLFYVFVRILCAHVCVEACVYPYGGERLRCQSSGATLPNALNIQLYFFFLFLDRDSHWHVTYQVG